MEITYYHSEGSQTEKPKAVDINSSATVVYLRKNVERVTRTDEMTGNTYDLWEYDEAKLTYDEYERVLTERLDALTPYKETKTAYIEDTEVTFTSVPTGNLSVFVVDSEGNYPNYIVDRVTNRVTVSFDPCQYITTVTISIL